ncbi:MAG: PAS domain-containing protein, partial [Verrucomicrobiales bacterium]|nr:PAS domain-containing protein [Verrucomicrobiales bacterium]
MTPAPSSSACDVPATTRTPRLADSAGADREDLRRVMEAQQVSLDELQHLTAQLHQQREELRQANELLRARNAVLQETQGALQRSEAAARLVGLVASRTHNGVVITNAEGGVVWVNEGFTRITGYTLEDIAGRRPGHLLQGPGTDPATVAYMHHQLALQRGFTTEILNYARNGRPYWVAIEVQPVRDERGTLTHFLAIETDITHRREAEEALRAETEVHTTTLASILDGVIAVSPDACVQILNPAAEALTGWPLALALGRPLAEVLRLTDEDGSPAPDLLAEALSRGA